MIFLRKPKLEPLLEKGKTLFAWGKPQLAPLRKDIAFRFRVKTNARFWYCCENTQKILGIRYTYFKQGHASISYTARLTDIEAALRDVRPCPHSQRCGRDRSND